MKTGRKQKSPGRSRGSQDICQGICQSICQSICSLRLVGNDVNELPVLGAPGLELDLSFSLGKQRVIFADTHVDAGMEARAALANEDVARQNLLSAIAFYAKSF